jgi:hypothetical protein
MAEVFRFFGFGENFINMMETIGTNRYAAIIFEDGTISKRFPLGSGRPQGDSPSPLQYNMGEQILLLKIELDPLIASVYQHLLAPRFAMNLVPDPRRRGVDFDYNIHFAQESNRETDKANSFADDNSTATLCTQESLAELQNVVSFFGTVSGLKSNVDKTTLMQIGRVTAMPAGVTNLGFNLTEEVTLLGMKIDRNLSTLENYFDLVLGKIVRIREYWEKFNLSLAGRIRICKTFMLSQIGYLGCIITPSDMQCRRLQECMDSFCLGTMNIAKKRLYWPVDEGGLGLIELKKYISAIQTSWIKRVMQHWSDNWRFDIKKACYGNPAILSEKTFNQAENPILWNIGNSFQKFKTEYFKKDKNYLKANIFKNPQIQRGRNDAGLLCENFFGRHKSFEYFCEISKLKVCDFFEHGRPKTIDSLVRETNIDFTLVTYMRVHEALQYYLSKKIDLPAAPAVGIEFFFGTFEKGSSPIRNILQHYEIKSLKIQNLNSVKTFFDLVGILVPDVPELKKLWGTWSKNCF